MICMTNFLDKSSFVNWIESLISDSTKILFLKCLHLINTWITEVKPCKGLTIELKLGK